MNINYAILQTVASCHCLLHVSVILLQKVCLLVKHVDSLFTAFFTCFWAYFQWNFFRGCFTGLKSEIKFLHILIACFKFHLFFTGPKIHRFFPRFYIFEPLQNSQFFFTGYFFCRFSQVFHGFSSNSDSQQGWIMSVHKQDLMACAGVKAWAP